MNFYKPIEHQDLIRSIHNLAERYGITDKMTKNFLVYNFQKEKTQNGKKMLNDYRRAKPKNLFAAKSSWTQEATSFI